MKPPIYLPLAVLLSLSAHAAGAGAETSMRLAAAKPGEVGLDAAKLDQIDGVVQASIDERASFPAPSWSWCDRAKSPFARRLDCVASSQPRSA